jgi:hypothetical protein
MLYCFHGHDEKDFFKSKEIFMNILNPAMTTLQIWALLHGIDDPYFQQGLDRHFRITNHTLTFSSFCWLYCWAVAGGRYAGTAVQVQQIWPNIFRLSLNAFTSQHFLPIARKSRYAGF